MIDLLTEGRSRFGVGLGWNHVEFDALSLYFARGVGTAFAPSQFGDGPVLTASYAM